MNHRNKIIILPALLICLHLSAQYADGIYTLHYTNSAGEQGVTTYIYNGRVTPYKAIWELKDGSRWSENYHEFDSQGKLARKYREFSDSLTIDQSFIYNSNGELVHETFSRSDGVTGEVDYLYDNGRCLKAVCRGLNGWFFGEIQYHYGESGMKDSATLVMEGNRAGNVMYGFDSKERLEKEVWTFSAGFTQTFLYGYIETGCLPYRSSNVFIRPGCHNVVKTEKYDYNGEGGGPSHYDYGEDNRLLKKTFVRSDGLKTTTDFTYGDNGLLKESVRHYYDGKTGTFTYAYDQHHQLVRREFQRSDGFTGTEEYRYGSHGRLLSGKYVNFDGWLTGDLRFTHDRYDRISTATFKGTGGSGANILFDYDGSNNLVSIHWVFLDGTTQTYWFGYFPLKK